MTIEPWRVEGARVSYEDDWLKVVTESCRTGQGRLLGDYHVLHYPDWVNVVALTERGQVLLVREYRHARRSISLGLPGGAVERTDATPLAAAQRELLEETGYAAPRWILLGSSTVNAATHNNLLWSFLALGATPTVSPSLDPSEDVELVLSEVDEVLNGLGESEEVQSLHLASLLHAVRFVLSDQSEEMRAIRSSSLSRLLAPRRRDERA